MRSRWVDIFLLFDGFGSLGTRNAIEQAIRPIAVGPSNYLFSGSARGGRAAATMYSVIGTARLNGINPYQWLKDVLARLPSYLINRVSELLPLPAYPWA